MDNLRILITGGCGYIGSHVALHFAELKHEVILLDNFENSTRKTSIALKNYTHDLIQTIECDLLDAQSLNKIMSKTSPDIILHLAGKKSVTESVINPEDYYLSNVSTTINLINSIKDINFKSLIFSSSSTVYGNVSSPPFSEISPLHPINPYGKTKLWCEQILCDFSKSKPNSNIVSLRYFNPIGSHQSGLVGDNPKNPPNNLMPILVKVASGEQSELKIFGGDYNTLDGTALRDYIDINDLALAHIEASFYKKAGYHTFNVGTGKPTSVLELIKTFQETCNVEIPYTTVERRQGDVESSYCDISLITEEIGWRKRRTLSEMCQSAWHYYKNLENV